MDKKEEFVILRICRSLVLAMGCYFCPGAFAKDPSLIALSFSNDMALPLFEFKKGPSQNEWSIIKDHEPQRDKLFHLLSGKEVVGTFEFLSPFKKCFQIKYSNSGALLGQQEVNCQENSEKDESINVVNSRYFKTKSKMNVLKKVSEAREKSPYMFHTLDQRHERQKPLLATTTKTIQNPDAWELIAENQLSSKERSLILNEVLRHRSPQKCNNEREKKNNPTELKISEAQLKLKQVFRSLKLSAIGAIVEVKDIDELRSCNENEVGIPSAFVFLSGGVAKDLLQSQNWNARELKFIEAKDFNEDGRSEIIFIDEIDASEGISLFDPRTSELLFYPMTRP